MIASAPSAIIESLRNSVPFRTSARRRFADIVPTGTSTKAGATRLPTPSLRAGSDRDGNHHAESATAGGLSPGLQQLVQGPGHHAQHDVVHRSPQRILH